MAVKSYKFRFYPTAEQAEKLSQTFGCVRVVYNKALCLRASSYKETGKGIGFNGTSAALTAWKKDPSLSWLKDPSCVPLQQSLRHLDKGFSAFFKKTARYPRYKKKTDRQSAEYTRSAFKWDAANRCLSIAKIGRLNVRWSRVFKAAPSTVSVSQTPSGKYYVSICIDEANTTMPNADDEVGIDLGITSLATLSDGTRTENIRTTKRYAKRLALAQRAMSRRTKGSNRRKRAKLRVAKIQEKIASIRMDWTHKTTTNIVKTKRTVVVEDLRVSNMLKNRKLAKSIADVSWFEFRRQLEYKCSWYGRVFVAVPPQYTSQTCSVCGHVSAENRLTQASFRCVSCGHQEHADINAAKNILAAGQAVKGRGESISRKPVLSGDRNSRRSVKHLNKQPS